MGGGGKGGDTRQAIYDPKTTNVLENALTGMAMGTAMRSNPALGQLFGRGQGMMNEPGYSGETRKGFGRKGDDKRRSQVSSQHLATSVSPSDFLSS